MRTEHQAEAFPTELHQERLRTVLQALLRSGAQSVLDLGCGSGALLRLLMSEPQFTRITGVDTSIEALSVAEQELCGGPCPEGERVSLLHASYADSDRRLEGYDAAAMVETIEHVDPSRLSTVEQAVFARYRPKTVVMTTPNIEYNVLFGMAEGALREPDHRFEWNRAKFRAWAMGVAKRNGYAVAFDGIGEEHTMLGCPTQMATFTRTTNRAD
ncbi:MAG: methyltransferase domain-containing protein [Burkholderiales bacterium]